MKFTQTELKGAYIIDPDKRRDDRGYFARIWCANEFKTQGLSTNLVQANISFNNSKGTLRGMHYQLPPYAEAKVVKCVKGAIYDVIIDIRKDSATYKQWIGVELTEENDKQLYVPEGFAHGFLTLSDSTEVLYLVSQFYTPKYERGIRYNDESFSITWPTEIVHMSDKDKVHPDFTEGI